VLCIQLSIDISAEKWDKMWVEQFLVDFESFINARNPHSLFSGMQAWVMDLSFTKHKFTPSQCEVGCKGHVCFVSGHVMDRLYTYMPVT
jgi:hypothetical protein